jgi:hypothetical protein
VVRALHYDNRANPAAADALGQVFAWRTTFNSAGARLEYGAGWTVIAQWLGGRTEITPGGYALDWPFDARYLLLSRRLGNRQRLSVRYDRFLVESRNSEPDGEQSGHAWTVAYRFDPGKGWSLTLEGLRVTSSSYIRGEELGRPGPVTDTQVQLAIRYALGSAGY